jgi:hypothetical protein
MSPAIRPVPASEPTHLGGRSGMEGGTTSATGSPNLVIRTGFFVRRTRSRTPRQVALNLEIAIVSNEFPPMNSFSCTMIYDHSLFRPGCRVSAVSGDAPKSQHARQLPVLSQTDFGSAKGPVFVAHQAKHGQQLGQSELEFADASPVKWKNCGHHVQGDSGKGQVSGFGHSLTLLEDVGEDLHPESEPYVEARRGLI